MSYKSKTTRKHVQFQPYNHPNNPNRPSLLKIKNHNIDINKRQYPTVLDEVLRDADIANKLDSIVNDWKDLAARLNML